MRMKGVTAGLRRNKALLILAILINLASMRPAYAEGGEAEEVGPYPGTLLWQTDMRGSEVVARLQRAISGNGMMITAELQLPAIAPDKVNCTVLLVYRDADAARTLQAKQAAGMEWPIRLYVSEGRDHKASVTYRTPSSIFALYDSPALDQVAGELDQRFAKIIDDAIGG